MKSDLQHLRDSYFNDLLWFAGLVAVGVAMEGPEIFHDLWDKKGEKPGEKKEEKRRWIVIVALLGWLFVAIGVAGEGICEALMSRADGLVQTFNDILLSDAETAAANARDRAAHAELETVRLRVALGEPIALARALQGQTRDLRGDTSQLQVQALELQGLIKAQNDQILANGPRSGAIDRAAPELIKQLSLFPGQHFLLYMAAYMTVPAPQAPTDEEAFRTWASIRQLLIDGAKWKLVDPQLRFSPSAPPQGIWLYASSAAPEQTSKAAKALSDGIARVLPQSSGTIVLQYPMVYRRVHGSMTPKGVQLGNPDDPETRIYLDPGLIVVLIGGHPIP